MKTNFISTLIVGALLSGAAVANPVEISRSITDIAAGADRHDWQRVRAAFADEVTVDYTSLWGGSPTLQASDELVAGWSAFLPGFDATHHIVTNHTVSSLSDDAATAQADFTATHRIDDQLWTLGGRYTYELKLSGNRWVVTSLTMTALWETGDRGLVAVAGQRAKTSN